MTTEEKAKAYDEALEKARKRVATDPQDHTVTILKDIFPELAESEDERIRKDIIAFLQSMNSHCDPAEGIIPKLGDKVVYECIFDDGTVGTITAFVDEFDLSCFENDVPDPLIRVDL